MKLLTNKTDIIFDWFAHGFIMIYFQVSFLPQCQLNINNPAKYPIQLNIQTN